MKSDNDLKYYLVGYNGKLVGFSYDKIMVKELIKERGKEYSFIKVKNKKIHEMIDKCLIPEIVYLEGHLLFSDEEPEFMEGFSQYQIDFIYYAKSLLKTLKYIKFSDDEINIIKDLILELRDYIEAMEHGCLCDDETGGSFEYFNYSEAIKWYKKNVLCVGDKK